MAQRARKRTSAEPTLREAVRDSGETPVNAAAEAERLDREDFAFLAREFLTWLVFHADSEGGHFDAAGDLPSFTIQLGGKLTLRSPHGLVTDMTLKGPAPALSADLHYAFAGGLAVKEADLVLALDGDEERSYSFGLAAEHFDLKRVKLPALLSEEDDQVGDERLMLLFQLDAAVEHAFAEFVALRARPTWARTVVPALRAWLDDAT